MEDQELLEGLEDLQNRLASQELLYGPKRKSKGGNIEFLVFKKDNLKIKIDPNINHARPHFHVDYGHIFHAVSICIESGKVLAGSLPERHLKIVEDFALKNKNILIKIWSSLREHKDPRVYLKEIKGN